MALKPLNIPKKGLKLLQHHFKNRRKAIKARLTKKKFILSHDEKWLNGEANLTDE